MQTTLTKLKELIAQGEAETFELKKSTSLLQAAFETICAFLNEKGGIVVIGVNNEGKIIGQNVTDKTRQEIANHVAKLEPSAQAKVDIEYVTVGDDKHVIAITVVAGNHRPYIYDGRAFMRNQSTTSRMPQHRYEQLIVERGQLNHSWDELFAVGYKVDDLNHDLILSVVDEAVNNKALPASALKENVLKILERFKVAKENQLLNAAMVLFGKDLSTDYPQCHIKLARFKGVNKREFLDNNYLYGSVFELLNQGELFIRRHLPVAAKVVPNQLRRIETPIIPLDAIREALLNALCHRDYSVRGGSVNVGIFDNRMELYSHGGLPLGVTIEKIKHGFSKPRNYRIAEVLHKCGYIEKWGRGIQNIIELCKEANVPEPEFLADDLEFKIIFQFPYNIAIATTPKIKEQLFDNLTARQQEILNILNKDSDLKIKEIQGNMKKKVSEKTIRRELLLLEQMGMVFTFGHTHQSVWCLRKK